METNAEAGRTPVRCEYCGDDVFVADPLAPHVCPTCDEAMTAAWCDAVQSFPTDEDAARYEREMEARASR